MLGHIKMLVLLATTITVTANAKVYYLTTPEQVKEFFAQNKPAVIMESADWCPACVKSKPKFIKASKAFEGEVLFGILDIDKIRLKKQRYSSYIPSFVAGRTEQEIRSAKSLGFLKKYDNTEAIIKYVEKFTKVKRCK